MNETCDGVVLVVDDDDNLRVTLCELLELRGFRAIGAHDGVEAIACLRSRQDVCFMVLDLLMPRMDGVQVLRALSGDARFRDLGVCVSTATVERAPLGVPLLPKPIDMDRLVSMIHASDARRPRRQALAS